MPSVEAYTNMRRTQVRKQAKKEIARRIAEELARRVQTDEGRAEVEADVLRQTHAKQRAAIEDPTRFQAWCCGRRAGKTAGVARKILLALLKAGYNQYVFYIAPTLGIGKDQIWPELDLLIKRYRLPWDLRAHEGTITTDRKARFRIVGLDKEPQVDKLRGYDTVLFITDETQNYEHLLPPLLAAVAPALTGRRGQWVSVGTPGPTMEGFWYDISENPDPKRRLGFVYHHWTVEDNSYSPRPGAEIIAEELERNGWDTNHPTAQRELFGKWCEDTNFLVCEFSATKNLVPVPEGYGPHWSHVIGLDYGYVDPSAWVVLAVDPHSQKSIVVHSEEYSPAGGTEDEKKRDVVAEITHRLVTQYGTSQVVCDPGGGGKPFYEMFNARFGTQLGASIRGANKVDKLGTIALLNTELRIGRLTVVPEAVTLISQLRTLRWKDPRRRDILEGVIYPDHSFDALRYALIEAAPWAVQERPVEITPEDRLRQERQKRQEKKQKRLWHER